MKTTRLSPALLFAGLFVLALAGCSSLDMTPSPTGDRVLTGTVNCRAGSSLPADAVVTVRLLDLSKEPPAVLASKTYEHPGDMPVAFSLDYKAEDVSPPSRAGLDARISVGGKLRYYNANPVYLSPNSAADPFPLWVEAMRGVMP